MAHDVKAHISSPLPHLDLPLQQPIRQRSSLLLTCTRTRPPNRQHALPSRQETPGPLPRILTQQRIHNRTRRHSLDNRHRPRHHTRIMPPLGLQRALLPIKHRRRLRLANRRGRLERHAEVHGRPVRDPALDAAGVVRRRHQPRRVRRVPDKGVVVPRPGDRRAREARADLEPLGRGDREHRVREQRLELVERGLPEPGGQVADDAGDDAADRVVRVAVLLDDLRHGGGGGGGRAAGREVGVDGGARDGGEEIEEVRVGGWGGVLGGGGEEVLGADGGDEGDDFDVVREGEVFLGDGAGSDTA
jgi:hypothetical protein